jgi:hypothetical protein
MSVYLLDLDLDGYDNEGDRKKACDVFIMDQLNFSASSVHFEHLEETSDGPTIKQLADLWNLCRRFVNEYKPSCPESICQVDETNLACTEFVEEICTCVGFYTNEEEK